MLMGEIGFSGYLNGFDPLIEILLGCDPNDLGFSWLLMAFEGSCGNI